jgi:hypothetical protein
MPKIEEVDQVSQEDLCGLPTIDLSMVDTDKFRHLFCDGGKDCIPDFDVVQSLTAVMATKVELLILQDPDPSTLRQEVGKLLSLVPPWYDPQQHVSLYPDRPYPYPDYVAGFAGQVQGWVRLLSARAISWEHQERLVRENPNYLSENQRQAVLEIINQEPGISEDLLLNKLEQRGITVHNRRFLFVSRHLMLMVLRGEIRAVLRGGQARMYFPQDTKK